ncbi:MAG: class D sortase [Acidobacteria bacterium]|nr:class D sortase [Acidobacteriota bacterium]
MVQSVLHAGLALFADTLPSPSDQPDLVAGAATVTEGSLIGNLEISRVGVDAIVLEGAAEPTLRVALGHVSGTAMPGESGNIAIAGHRDTFLRGLRKVQDDDLITLQTAHGSFEYRVQSMKVVDPGDLDTLRPTREPTLTLITCYPFHFIGPAPKRFIVRARQTATYSR